MPANPETPSPDRILSLRNSAKARRAWALRTPAERSAITQPARDGRMRKYLARVDAESPGLPEEERRKRARQLYSADMRAACAKAVASRRAKTAAREAASDFAERMKQAKAAARAARNPGTGPAEGFENSH